MNQATVMKDGQRITYLLVEIRKLHQGERIKHFLAALMYSLPCKSGITWTSGEKQQHIQGLATATVECRYYDEHQLV